jgi:hypothetical protein
MTRAEEFAHAAVTAATRGNVTIYPVNPAGLATSTTSADVDRPPAQDRLPAISRHLRWGRPTIA